MSKLGCCIADDLFEFREWFDMYSDPRARFSPQTLSIVATLALVVIRCILRQGCPRCQKIAAKQLHDRLKYFPSDRDDQLRILDEFLEG